jgi:dTDP-glucose 4,6-dehydratase
VAGMSGAFEQTNVDTVKKIIKYYFDTDIMLEKHVDFSYCREGQDVRYALDDSKLYNLGWSPKKNFDDEIKEIVKYYKNSFIW